MTFHHRPMGLKVAAAVATFTAVAAGLIGCGGQSMPSSAMNITGNWELEATPAGSTTAANAVRVYLPVYLIANSGNVSGMVLLPPTPDLICAGNCCGGTLSAMNPSLTGTVDANGNLALGSANPPGAAVFNMKGMVSGATLSNGSFTLTGMCGAQGTMAGIEYPPIDGTYTGAMASQNLGQSFTVTLVLSQSSGPNASGFLGLTGSLSPTGYSCLASTALQVSTSFVGNSFGGQLNIATKESFGYTGTLSADGKTIAFTYGLVGGSGSCSGDYGKGTLTLQ